ncbi:MAG: sulfur carrier protein ThiS [Opitutales bacterium]
MTVFVNESPKEMPESSDLSSLLREIGIEEPVGVAVAVNGAIVQSDKWAETHLSANDQVLVVRATQGG